MTTEATVSTKFAKLGPTNYQRWLGDMRAQLQTKKVWSVVTGRAVRPSPDDDSKLEDFLEKEEMAAGLIFSALEQDQRVHVYGMEESPVRMWTASNEEASHYPLQRVHVPS